jgi:4-amino-4-deoxy-L-arabinose transferase-like glycosyltransferase
MIGRPKTKRAFAAIFLLALCLRIGFYLAVRDSALSGILSVRGDAARYQSLALNILNGKGFVTSFHYRAYRPPAYPFFLAALYRVGGPHPSLARAVQFLLSAAGAVLFAAAAARLFSRGVGVLTGVVLAAWPGLIYYSSQLLSETLFIFLLAVFFLLFLRLRPESSWWKFGAAGVLLGAGTLCRPIMLPFSLVLFFLNLGAGFTRKSLLIYLFCALTIAPWTIRNYLVLDHFVPVSTNGGINFLFGNNADNPEGEANFFKGERFQTILRTEVEEDRAARRAARAWIRDHPRDFLKSYLRKCVLFWNPVPRYFSRQGSFGPFKSWVQALLGGINLVTFALAGIGLFFLFQRRGGRRIHLLWLTPLYFTLAQSFFFVLYRFRLPVEPFVVILAASAGYHFLDKVKTRRFRAPNHNQQATTDESN